MSKEMDQSVLGSQRGENSMSEQSIMKQNKTVFELLREMDPDCTKEQMDNFFQHIYDMQSWMKIQENPKANIIASLRKIENEILYFCEARNFLNRKYKSLKPSERTHEMDIEQFENKLAKDKADLKFRKF